MYGDFELNTIIINLHDLNIDRREYLILNVILIIKNE